VNILKTGLLKRLTQALRALQPLLHESELLRILLLQLAKRHLGLELRLLTKLACLLFLLCARSARRKEEAQRSRQQGATKHR
jgi:hypothetical protein